MTSTSSHTSMHHSSSSTKGRCNNSHPSSILPYLTFSLSLLVVLFQLSLCSFCVGFIPTTTTTTTEIFSLKKNRKSGYIIDTKTSLPPFFLSNKQSKYKSIIYFSAISNEDTKEEEYDTTTNKKGNDDKYMKMALECARLGYGYTYPNPAVGCVIIQSSNDDEDDDIVIGKGFHPKSGMPHAEIFALFQAAGYVEDGVEAAKSVLPGGGGEEKKEDKELANKVEDLLQTYIAPNGANQLFSNIFESDDDDANMKKTTAYVTLEPCCHTKKQTPPCASTFALSSINRVVVGYRDPNPAVDGGGVSYLRSHGVSVNVMQHTRESAKECANIVRYFGKRITSPVVLDGDLKLNGKQKRMLRALAGRKKRDGSLIEIEWPATTTPSSNTPIVTDQDDEIDWEETVFQILSNTPPSPKWLTHVDGALWDHELVILRLGNVVAKKKGVKFLGEALVERYLKGCAVVQVVGHTLLLYRPSYPKAVIDLDGEEN